MKKFLKAMGLCFLLAVSAAPAMAEKLIIDVNISGLAMFDVGAFEMDVNYDDSSITFDRYFLTDALGSISLGDAEDWSLGDSLGSVNLSVFSYIADFNAEPLPQPNAFTLATIIFDTNLTLLAANSNDSYGIWLDNINLSDGNGDAIPFNVTGTEISAIPIPAAAWLLGSGIIGLAAIRRRR